MLDPPLTWEVPNSTAPRLRGEVSRLRRADGCRLRPVERRVYVPGSLDAGLDRRGPARTRRPGSADALKQTLGARLGGGQIRSSSVTRRRGRWWGGDDPLPFAHDSDELAR